MRNMYRERGTERENSSGVELHLSNRVETKRFFLRLSKQISRKKSEVGKLDRSTVYKQSLTDRIFSKRIETRWQATKKKRFVSRKKSLRYSSIFRLVKIDRN